MQDSSDISPLPEKDAAIVEGLLKQVLPNSSTSFIESHLEIVAAIKQLSLASMNDLAKLLNARPNYVHIRLKNLTAANILERKKISRGVSDTGRRLTEFVYLLHGYPSADSLDSAHSGNSPNVKSEEQATPTQPKSSIPAFNLTFKSRTLPPELPELPDFDKSWPVETQVEWLKTYQQLLEVRYQELKQELK